MFQVISRADFLKTILKKEIASVTLLSMLPILFSNMNAK